MRAGQGDVGKGDAESPRNRSMAALVLHYVPGWIYAVLGLDALGLGGHSSQVSATAADSYSTRPSGAAQPSSSSCLPVSCAA